MHYFAKYKLNLVKESNSKYEVNNKINGPKDIFDVAIEVLKIHEEPEEIMAMITLDVKNKITGIFEVSRGSLNSSVVHPRELLKRALLNNAGNIILIHNHPSGSILESKEDIEITQRIKSACDILGIGLLDHIIVGENEYLSLKEKGIF